MCVCKAPRLLKSKCLEAKPAGNVLLLAPHVLNYMHMHFGYLQIRVKHVFYVLCFSASVHTRVVLQAYNIVKQLLYVCYVLFVVNRLCYFRVVRHVVCSSVFVCVLSVYMHTHCCQLLCVCYSQHCQQ